MRSIGVGGSERYLICECSPMQMSCFDVETYFTRYMGHHEYLKYLGEDEVGVAKLRNLYLFGEQRLTM